MGRGRCARVPLAFAGGCAARNRTGSPPRHRRRAARIDARGGIGPPRRALPEACRPNEDRSPATCSEDVSDAEDAVQETFLKVFRGAASFRARRALLDLGVPHPPQHLLRPGRTRRRRPEGGGRCDASRARFDLPAGERSPAPPGARGLGHAASRAAPDRVSAVGRRGSDAPEIGEILGVPEATSRTLLFEARRELQCLLWRGRSREARA